MNIYGSAWAEVELSAIEYNCDAIMKYVKERKNDTKILAVVKADGYGHGAIEVSRIFEERGIDYLGVATLFEALELRNAGIKMPILVFGYIPMNMVIKAIEHEITMTVSDLKSGEQISSLACELGKQALVHLKTNVGMNRLGFRCHPENLKIVKACFELEMVKVEGLFAHFPLADSKSSEETMVQGKVFQDFVKLLRSEGLDIPLTHICNTAATLKYPELYCDMVRVGGILYGHNCLIKDPNAPKIDVRQSLAIRSVIGNITEIKPGEGVSYGWLYKTEEKALVAAIGIGYTDGIDRRNTNKASFLFKGQRVNQVGLICMDQMMVDVSHVEDPQVGQVITLLGKDGDDNISLEERADAAGIGKCELLSQIGHRLPKIFFDKGQFVKEVNYLMK